MLNLYKSKSKNWLDIVKKEFDHPSVVLWRAVELRQIDFLFDKYILEKPILDLGCAEGKIGSLFFKEKSAVGLDNCWESIKENKKTDTYKGLVMADACVMPYKNKVFGSIFSNCVIEHISDLDKVLKEVHRVIKDRGIIIFTVPSHNFGDFLFFSVLFNGLGLKCLAKWYKTKRNKLLNHFHCYDHNRWREILDQNGFRVLEYKYYLSRRATCYWDLMAVIAITVKHIWPLNCLGCGINNWFSNRLNLYYNLESKDGGGLLILAEKSINE